MRKELVTPDELQAKLRENGIASLDQVARMTMESDGEISVIKKDQ